MEGGVTTRPAPFSGRKGGGEGASTRTVPCKEEEDADNVSCELGVLKPIFAHDASKGPQHGLIVSELLKLIGFTSKLQHVPLRRQTETGADC